MRLPGTATIGALGTFATVLTTEHDAAGHAVELLQTELAAVDLACSRFRPDSELATVNDANARRVRISPRLADALAVALEAARLTDGDVDPTCGLSLVRLGYDRDFATARQDTSPLRQLPVPGGSWRGVRLDPGRQELKVPAGVLLDLGGDISVAGDPPDGGWPVGIADDADFDSTQASITPRQVVVIRDGGLATSSVLERAWQRGGARLHHIIVPATGLPAHSCWRTVSVAAATCLDANIASTAAIIRGERAVQWLSDLRLPARLVRHDGTAITVGGWPAGVAT